MHKLAIFCLMLAFCLASGENKTLNAKLGQSITLRCDDLSADWFKAPDDYLGDVGDEDEYHSIKEIGSGSNAYLGLIIKNLNMSDHGVDVSFAKHEDDQIVDTYNLFLYGLFDFSFLFSL